MKTNIFIFFSLLFTSLSIAQNFSPDSIAGLKIWLKADSGITLNSGTVEQWQDFSINNNVAVQNNSLYQPLYLNTVLELNNKPVLKFDGNNDFLEVTNNPSIAFTSMMTLFIIYKQQSLSINQSLVCKWDYPTQGSWAIQTDAFNPNELKAYVADALTDAGNNNISTTDAILTNNKFSIINYTYDGNQSSINRIKFYKNSRLLTTSISGTIPSNLQNSTASLKIGMFGGVLNRFLNGDIAEIIIYDHTLTAQETDSIYNYFQFKYSPPINLGNDINIAYGFCDTTLSAYKPWFTSYIWKKNGSNDTLSIDSLISVNSSGNYKVIVTDIFGFTSTDSVTVSYPGTSFNCSDTTICLGDTIKIFSLLPDTLGYSFLWSTGESNSFINISTNSTIFLTLNDTLSCGPHQSSQITISLDSLSEKVNLGPDLSVCSGNYITLIQYPENPNSLSFYWSDNSTDSILTINNSGLYSVSVTNQLGCIGIDTIDVTILGSAPTVNFSADTVCFGSVTHFSNFSSLAYDSILWDFGDGNQDTNFNTVHTYSLPGTYIVTLYLAYSICSNTIQKIIVVKPTPIADFSSSPSCISQSVIFTDLSSPNGSGLIDSYFWDFDGLSTSTIQNPNFIFTNTGDFPVTLTITSNNGCTNTVSKNIITVASAPLSEVSLISPLNFSILSDTTILFKWTSDNSLKFAIQISSDPAFSNILYVDTLIFDQKIIHLSLTNNQTVFWRVSGFNYCAEPSFSSTFSFTYFNPNLLFGISVWLRADSVLIGGNKVNQWYDLSSNDNSALQTNPSFQPIKVDSINVLNNYPVIRLDGIDDFLEINDTNSIDFTDQFSIFVVAKQNSLSGYQGLISKWDYGTQSSWCIETWPSNELTTYIADQIIAEGNNNIKSFNVNFNKFNIYNILYNGNLSNENRGKHYINGINSTSLTNGTIVSSLINCSANLKIGTFGGLGRYFNGDYAEIILYNRTLPDNERILIEQYLRYKYNPPVLLNPTLNVSYGFCDTSISAYKPWFTSYVWQKEGSTTAISDDSIIHVNSSGNYKVTVTDIFGFTSTDSINVVFNGPQPTLLPDTAYCLGSSIDWNTGLSNADYSFLWKDNSIDSVLTIFQPGEYYYEITDSLGCMFYSDTIIVIEDSFEVVASLGPDTNLCSGNTISLVSGNNGITNYLWSDNSTNPYFLINTPGEYSVSVTNIHGCNAMDTIYVDIHGIAPVPAFSNGYTCLGNPILFTDESQTLDGSNIISWQWITITDTIYNQNITLTMDTLVTFDLQLIVSTDSLCSNFVIENITINPNPVAEFEVEGTCEGSTTYFTLQGSGSLQEWDWNFGDNTISTDYHTQHLYNEIGNYPVTLHITNNFGCEDSITKNVQIKLTPVAGFDFSPACTGNLTWFFDTSTVSPVFPIINRFWNFGDGGTSLQQNPSHIYSSVGQYNVGMYIHSLNGCSSTAIHTINVSAKPLAGFLGDSTCVGIPISFTDTSYSVNDSIYKWKWFFGNNTSSTLQNPAADYLAEGNYIVNLEVTSEVDCKDTISKVIHVYPLPEVDFFITPTFGPPGVQISTYNNSSSGQNFWYFGDGLTSNLLNPVHVYTDTGNYTIWLKVVNNHGCFDSTFSTISVIPNLYDLAVIDISSTQQNGFITVQITLANTGTMPIINPSLVLYSDVHTPVMEIFYDTLFSGQIVIYNLNSQLPVTNNLIPKYLCVKGLLSAGLTDIDLTNNESCQVLSDNNFVLNLYPNPTSENISIDLYISISGKSELEIFDKSGRVVTRQNYELQTGFNRLVIDVKDYAKGKYNVQIKVPEGTESLEFVKY